MSTMSSISFVVPFVFQKKEVLVEAFQFPQLQVGDFWYLSKQ